MKDVIPQGEVFTDEQEEKAARLMEEFKKNKDPELLRRAADEFEVSANTEGREIASLLRAWYLREKGMQEKDHDKACVFLIKSYSAFNKDPKMNKDAKRVLMEFYNRKIEALHLKNKDVSEVYQKRAKICKELGLDKDYHVEMSLCYLQLTLKNPRNLTESVKQIELSLKHAEESGREELIYKIKGIFHRIKSYASTTPEQAIRELEEEIKAIERTSDKYGWDGALGDLHFLKSRIEKEPEKRVALLKEAAEFYEKAGMDNRAHQLRGDILQLQGHNTKPQDPKHAEYYKDASEEYGKAGNLRMQKWLEGHYEIALATKLGILEDNNKKFEKHLLAANHCYKDAGNAGGVQFTAGVGLFLEAIRADYPKKIELLRVAADCLDSVGEKFLSAFARSEISQELAAKAENQKERFRLIREEKNYLERAIIESEKKERKTEELKFPIGGKIITAEVLQGLNRARFHELNGFLEEDRELKKKHFLKAKQEYLSLMPDGSFQTIVLSGLAWCSLFVEDISEAKKYFQNIKDINPDNPHVKAGFEALDELIRVKYSQEADNYLIRKRLSVPLMVSLTEGVSLVVSGKPYPSEFFNLCCAIVKRSCGQLERFRKDFINLDEPSLRNQILMLSNGIAASGLGTTLTGETFTCEGKSDLFAQNSEDNEDSFIGECKIWESPSSYKKGFKQLIGRYLTTTDKAGLLINFIKDGSLPDVIDKAISAIKELDPEVKINKVDDKNFVSTHKEYGIILHHFVDLVSNKQRIK